MFYNFWMTLLRVASLAFVVCVLVWSASQLRIEQQSRFFKVSLYQFDRSLLDLSVYPDLAQELPLRSSTQAAYSYVQRSAQVNGVVVQSVKLSETPPSATALGQHNWQVSLSGTYGGVKAVLADVGHHYPQVVLKSLQLRAQPSGQVDATVNWVFLRQPLGVSP